MNRNIKFALAFSLLVTLTGCGEKNVTQSTNSHETAIAPTETLPTLPSDYTSAINENAIVSARNIQRIITSYSTNVINPFLSKQPPERITQGEFEKTDEFKKRVLEQEQQKKLSIDLPSDWKKKFGLEIPASISYDPDRESFIVKLRCSFKPFQNTLTNSSTNEIFCVSDKQESERKDGVITYKRQINYGPVLTNLSQDLLPEPGTMTFNFDYAINDAKALGSAENLVVILVAEINPTTILDDSKNKVDGQSFFGSFVDDGKGGVTSRLPDKYETIPIDASEILVINNESRKIVFRKTKSTQ